MNITQKLAPAGAKVTLPSHHVTHPKFKYVPVAQTDVRRTFRKFRLLARIQGAMA